MIRRSTALAAASSLVVFAFVAGCSAPVGTSPEDVGAAGEDLSTQARFAPGSALAVADVTDAPAPCVEAGRYDVHADVVVDTQNGGRAWQRAVDATARTQADAAAYCASLTLGGVSGWRLPTVVELNTLKLRPVGLKGGPDSCIPSIDQSAFPGTPADEFWSSTTRQDGDATVGLYTGFDDGRTHPADPTTAMHARCMHDAVLDANAAP